MNLTLPGRKRALQPAQVAPEPTVEDEVLAAAQACDEAMAALALALARRRKALIQVTARTGVLGCSHLTRCFSPSVIWSAVTWHGAGLHLGLPHVQANHRRSFLQSAQAALSASAPYRKPPANEEESRHAIVA